MQSYNNVPLTRLLLLDLLNDLQQRTLQAFGCPIRLFVHGGAVMLLHPYLSPYSTRRTTRDVDYISRAFGHEWRKKGVYDAEDRLRDCIDATAQRFRIGADWMNADPDVALPFAREPRGYTYDPIHFDAKQPDNVNLNTIYTSPGITLISITMFWGIALKLVRYEKDDPNDIVAMLRHGSKFNGMHWTPQVMEDWIKTLCWPMGYDSYQPQRLDELRDRIHDAVRRLRNEPDDFAVAHRRSHEPVRTRRPSVHALRIPEHRSHSHTSQLLSPLSSPALPVSMPEPWIPSTFSSAPAYHR